MQNIKALIFYTSYNINLKSFTSFDIPVRVDHGNIQVWFSQPALHRTLVTVPFAYVDHAKTIHLAWYRRYRQFQITYNNALVAEIDLDAHEVIDTEAKITVYIEKDV